VSERLQRLRETLGEVVVGEGRLGEATRYHFGELGDLAFEALEIALHRAGIDLDRLGQIQTRLPNLAERRLKGLVVALGQRGEEAGQGLAVGMRQLFDAALYLGDRGAGGRIDAGLERRQFLEGDGGSFAQSTKRFDEFFLRRTNGILEVPAETHHINAHTQAEHGTDHRSAEADRDRRHARADLG